MNCTQPIWGLPFFLLIFAPSQPFLYQSSLVHYIVVRTLHCLQVSAARARIDKISVSFNQAIIICCLVFFINQRRDYRQLFCVGFHLFVISSFCKRFFQVYLVCYHAD